ncbi:MAG: hypothetical protein LC104_17825 [Bacteroidales bacterium]|nr:hypothetical protein [Bacteroidales bacterium]
MKRKLSLNELIQTLTGLASVMLLGVIAERSEPGGDLHWLLLAVYVVVLIVHMASTCFEESSARPKPPQEMDNQDRKESNR